MAHDALANRDGDSAVCTGPMHRHSDRCQQHSRSTLVRTMTRAVSRASSGSVVLVYPATRGTDHVRRAARCNGQAAQRLLHAPLNVSFPSWSSTILLSNPQVSRASPSGSAHPTTRAGNGLIYTHNPCFHPSLSSSSGSQDQDESDLKLVN